MVNFKQISWRKLKKLAKDGTVGPHGSIGIDMALLVAGKKPIWLATKSESRDFLKHFPDFRRVLVPELKELDDYYYKYGVYHKNNIEARDAFLRVFELYPVGLFQGGLFQGDGTLTHDIELGRVLGYTEADIAKFIEHNLTKEEFEEWQMEEECKICG